MASPKPVSTYKKTRADRQGLTQGNILTVCSAASLRPAGDFAKGRVGGGADGGVEQTAEPQNERDYRLRRGRRTELKKENSF